MTSPDSPSSNSNQEKQRFARLQDLFRQCVELPLDQREPWLNALHDESQLKEDLAALLEIDKNNGLTDAFHVVPERLMDPGTVPDHIGEFRLLHRLGEGGMGIVFAAIQESVGRTVALKVVRPGHLFFDDARLRFRREAEAIAGLHHPAIATLHTYGEDEISAWLALELVDGRDLAKLIKKLVGSPLSGLQGKDLLTALEQPPRDQIPGLFVGGWTETCLRIASEVAHALCHAHERGVFHRDIKPSNIMVTVAGRVVLLDFGIALRQGEDRMTATGVRPGSLPYMAPEQIAGREKASGLTDVYSLGVTLHELLTLQPAFDSTRSDDLAQTIQHQMPVAARRLNARVGRDMQVVLNRAMAKVPEDRYANMASFARDLDNLIACRPIDARRTSLLHRGRRWSQRNRLAAALISGLCLAVVGISWMYVDASEARAAAARSNEEYRSSISYLFDTVRAADSRHPDGRGEGTRLKDLLLAYSEGLSKKLGSSPRVEADFSLQLGITFWHGGEIELSATHLARAHELFERLEGRQSSKAVHALCWRGRAIYGLGTAESHETGKALMAEAYRRSLSLPMTDEARYRVAEVQSEQLGYSGKAQESRIVLERAYQESLSTRGSKDVGTLGLMQRYGYALTRAGQDDAGGALMRRCVQLCLEITGENSPRTLYISHQFAIHLFRIGQFREGLPLVENVVRWRIKNAGKDTAPPAYDLCTLATAYDRIGETKKAYDLLVQCVAAVPSEGERIPSRFEASSLLRCARVARKLGRADQARTLLDRALTAFLTTADGRVDWELPESLALSAHLHMDGQDLSAALKSLEQMHSINEAHHVKRKVMRAGTCTATARYQALTGNPAAGREILDNHLALIGGEDCPQFWAVHKIMRTRQDLESSDGEAKAAAGWGERASSLMTRIRIECGLSVQTPR